MGRGRKTWGECVRDDVDELGLQSECLMFHGFVEKPHIRKNI